MKTFNAGDKVRSYRGEILTVLWQQGCQVYCLCAAAKWQRGYFHPTKLFKI